MNRLLTYLKGLGLLVALCLLIGIPNKIQAQFRGPNKTPPVVIFPPVPPYQILNNGSLYTWPNPTNGLPGQLPFAFIAVAHQDCRLYHNGATLMPFPRLVAGQCTDMIPMTIPLSNGFIPPYNSVLFPLGGAGGGGMKGFGASRGDLPIGGYSNGLYQTPSYYPSIYEMYRQQMALQLYQGYLSSQYASDYSPRLPGATVPTNFFGNNSLAPTTSTLTADKLWNTANGFGGLGNFETTGFGNFNPPPKAEDPEEKKDGRKDE
jgi:hypothetical protein